MRIARKCSALVLAQALFVVGCDRATHIAARSDSSPSRPAQTALAAQPSHGSFGYVDSSGMELLSLDSLRSPAEIRAAICAGGGAVAIRYDRWQARGPLDNGRQDARNFANESGQIFRVQGPRAPPNASCYLSPDSALVANAVPVTVVPPGDCSSDISARLAALGSREVLHCWHIADAAPRLTIVAVQYVTIDSNALARLAIVGDSTLVFEDLPAVSNKAQGTWRVDDGGVFSPADFDFLFVAVMPYGFVIATDWTGAEGESCTLDVAPAVGVFRVLDESYRYRAPL